jgi:hypothetical protein
MPVHHIDMYQIGPGGFGSTNLLTQLHKIG